MRILFVCENYYPHRGGAEVLFQHLAEGYVRRGHHVTMLTHHLRGTKKRETLNGVKIERVSSLHSRYVFTFSSVKKAIALARRHDIIQTTTFNGAPTAWLAGRLTKKPVVLTVHEVWVGKWREIMGFTRIKSLVHELLERSIYLLPYDSYVCVSEATKSDLLALGVNSQRVQRIYNGLDYDFWDPKKINQREIKKLREHLGLKGRFVYYAWGRPGVSKGFEYLIAAMPHIVKEVPNALLLLMFGSVEQYRQNYRKLLQLIRSQKGAQSTTVLPSVSAEQNRTLIALADCVVVPSISEGFGYNAVEALAMGKPIVVSDAGSLPEVVSGKYLLCKKKDARDLADKVIEMARGNYRSTEPKRYLWDQCIQRYENIYFSLINGVQRFPTSSRKISLG